MVRALALLLTVLTGVSGLVYEVTWQRYLGTLLGSDSEATAAVLAIFLGGLSVGYSLFGRVTHAVVERAAAAGRPPHLLRLYGFVEAGIGVWALCFPWLFVAARSASFALHSGATGIGFVIDVGFATLLLGPPTILMGGTIPILTQALARSIGDATRIHAWVYAFNTAGAFMGALAAGFYLIPTLGLEGCLRAMGIVNLFAGSAFLALGARTPDLALPVSAPAPDARAKPAGFASYAVIATLYGFAMMAIQTVLNRLGGLAFGASHYTFAMVVAAFVFSIATGSFLVSAFSRIPRLVIFGSQWLLVVLLYLLYRPAENVTYWVYGLRALFPNDDSAFLAYWMSAFLGLLAVLVTPIALAGATLPLLFHHLRREMDDLGGVAGRLYSWNTLGSLLGALLGGYALLFVLDLHHVYRLAVASLALAVTLLGWRVLERPLWQLVAVVLVPATLALAALPAWRTERLQSGLFRVKKELRETGDDPDRFFQRFRQNLQILFHDDDPVSSVAVGQTDMPEFGRTVSINNNGKSDGAIPVDNPTMVLAAILPALFAEKVERAFVIGYGTGMTVGELAAIPSVERVDVAEVSPAVIAAAPHFDFGNLQASKSPKVRMLRGDAYRFLVRGDEKYDVIASEPSNPWVTGVEMLFSREFLETAKSRLAPGGVYCQWIHVYETSDATVELVLRTYAQVFDHVAVWYALGPDLLLLGFDDDARATDLARLEERATTARMRAALARARIPSFPALLAHELLPIGAINAAGLQGDVHTLARPILSHRAARAFFTRATARLPVLLRPEAAALGRDRSLLRRFAERSGGSLDETAWAEVTREICADRFEECATLLAAWSAQRPGSAARDEVMAGIAAKDPDRDRGVRKILRELVLLYTGPSAGEPVALAQVLDATALYRRYSLHAMPFPRSALDALWSQCRDPDGNAGACERNHARAVEWLQSAQDAAGD